MAMALSNIPTKKTTNFFPFRRSNPDMGVSASAPCLLISLLILQTLISISALPNPSSFQHAVSNHSQNSVPQVLVSPRDGAGGGGGEEKRTVGGGWFVSKTKGGRSGGLGGSNINHRPNQQNQKNAASSLPLKSSFAANSAGLIVLVFNLLLSF